MSKAAARPKKTAAPEPAKPADKGRRSESGRDGVEQVVVALILAFLIRGFEAEAFVIPTGSMAPTLMGRHKDVDCPQCGITFQVNASEEVEGSVPSRIVSGVCWNCRYQAKIDEAVSFKGDRILVMKSLYGLPFLPGRGGPFRWDVVVFKYPNEPEVNYIKRCIGLPNEEVRIHYGDVLTRPLGSKQPFRLARKPLNHLQAMQMLVYDDAYRSKAFAEFPEWRRWAPGGGDAWTEATDGVYRSKADAPGWAQLRYRHFVSDPKQWRAVLSGEKPAPPRKTLITDFYSYNSGQAAGRDGHMPDWYRPHWVGDLGLTFDVTPEKTEGKLRIELVEGGTPYRCAIDLATGQAWLYRGDAVLTPTPGETALKDTSRHTVFFANVDDRLTLTVDGTPVFGDGVAYEPDSVLEDGSPRHPGPTAADLDPVGIATEGASVGISGLVLKRDIYYTQNPGASDYEGLLPWSGREDVDRMVDTFDFLADPARFAVLGELRARDFPIRPGHYMMMGDNSPRSKDGRQWETYDQISPDRPESGWDPNRRESWEVPESLVIGKAFYVYWPHGKPFGPDIRPRPDIRIPFRPYWERMKWIR